ncbi:MAG: hypothetical protein ACJ73S_09965 [Mycobacteriales bacterium]
MQPLNPHLVHELAEQRAGEVRRAVRQSGRGPAHSRHPRTRLRYRTGWLLVDLGLRMTSAGPSAS